MVGHCLLLNIYFHSLKNNIMKLIIGNWYHVYIFDDYILKIKLLKIINRANSHYEWEHEDGRIFNNRQVDVETWIKRKQFKEII